MQILANPQVLAAQTTDDIMHSLKTEAEGETMLVALQMHYDTLHKSQDMYIEYMTEFIQKIKETHHKDKESLSNLKRQVLRHILDGEKAKK